MVNAQDWLDEWYPKDGLCSRKDELKGSINNFGKTRGEIKKLNISEQELEGELDLSDFTELTHLLCFRNKLSKLNLSNCLQLVLLDCPFSFNEEPNILDLNKCLKLNTLCIDFALYSNRKITSLEGTSLTLLDVKFSLEDNFNLMWKNLLEIHRKFLPEMDLIDVSDLTKLARQVNEQTVNDEVFLTEICPKETNKFVIKKNKEGIHPILEQLASRILARILILHNRLFFGKDEGYENETNELSLKCLKIYQMKFKNIHTISERKNLYGRLCDNKSELGSKTADLSWMNLSVIRDTRENTANQPKPTSNSTLSWLGLVSVIAIIGLIPFGSWLKSKVEKKNNELPL